MHPLPLLLAAALAAAPATDPDGDALPPGAVARLGHPRHRTQYVPFAFPKVRTATFTPDGKSVVTLSGADRVAVWDAATGKLTRDVWLVSTTGGSRGGASLAANGSAVAVPYYVGSGTGAGDAADVRVHVWDVGTGELRRVVAHVGQKLRPSGYRLTADGKAVVYEGDADGPSPALRVWDVATGEGKDVSPKAPEAAAYLDRPTEADVLGVVSPDGKYRLTGTDRFPGDAVWHVTEVATGRRLWPEPAMEPRLVPLAWVVFSADGKYLAASRDERDQAVSVWEVATGKLAFHSPTTIAPGLVAFAPEGNVLVWGGLDIGGDGKTKYHLYDLDAGKRTDWPASKDALAGWVKAGEPFRDGGFGMLGRDVAKAVTGEEPMPTPRPKLANVPQFEPTEKKRLHSDGSEGGKFAVWLGEPAEADARKYDPRKFPETVSVWDVATGQVVDRVTEERDRLVALPAPPGGKARYSYRPASTRWVRITPDGKRVFLVGAEGVREWAVGSGRPPAPRFTDPWARSCLSAIRYAVLSPDGTRLATPMPDGQVLVWDVSPAK